MMLKGIRLNKLLHEGPLCVHLEARIIIIIVAWLMVWSHSFYFSCGFITCFTDDFCTAKEMPPDNSFPLRPFLVVPSCAWFIRPIVLATIRQLVCIPWHLWFHGSWFKPPLWLPQGAIGCFTRVSYVPWGLAHLKNACEIHISYSKIRLYYGFSTESLSKPHPSSNTAILHNVFMILIWYRER